jgi:hypothetical protein
MALYSGTARPNLGYNLYLVKVGEDWGDDQNHFSQAEWDAICANHDVKAWAYFDGVHVTVKNPTDDQVRTLVAVGRAHGWRVQGDDGEFYSDNGQPVRDDSLGLPPAARERWLARFLYWLRSRFRSRSKSAVLPAPCLFKVGDKVRTSFRSGGIVTELDPSRNGGLGSIEVTFPDGVVLGFGLFAHDLSLEEPKPQ